MNDRVMANKWISHHHLLADTAIKGNLRGLLERGVQESMDKEEVFDETLEVAVGYAGSIGTALCQEHCPVYAFFFVFPFFPCLNPHSFDMTATTLFIPIFHSLTACLRVQYLTC
jgi:hypothetical protein